jgi:uncharacterized protein YciI
MSTEKKQFFLKLIPPRPTFAQDMSDEERKIMQEHIAYWNVLMEKGIVVVFGPVFDPKGAYGMGVLEVEDEQIVRDIEVNDPSVKAGLNTIEVYAMRGITKKR